MAPPVWHVVAGELRSNLAYFTASASGRSDVN
jgi:hypothetical protein